MVHGTAGQMSNAATVPLMPIQRYVPNSLCPRLVGQEFLQFGQMIKVFQAGRTQIGFQNLSDFVEQDWIHNLGARCVF